MPSFTCQMIPQRFPHRQSCLDWKLLQFKTKDGIDTHLYHLATDGGETTNVAAQFPEIVSMLTNQAMAARTKSTVFKSFLDHQTN